MEKHFQSIQTGIDSGVKTVRLYQAMLLKGTDMATSRTRKKFEFKTKFRVIPGCAGVYKFGNDDVAVAEFDEIIVQTKDLPNEDYLACRKMSLLIETFLNKGMFEEVFGFAASLDLEKFEILKYLHAHEEIYSKSIKDILSSFMRHTKSDLFDTREDALTATGTVPELKKYLNGEHGRNELLEHRAMMYLEFDDISDLLINCIKKMIRKAGNENIEDNRILDELNEYMVLRKRDIRLTNEDTKKMFSIDFSAINWDEPQLDKVKNRLNGKKHLLRFYHADHQKAHIKNVNLMYQHHSVGLGKMLQNNNLRPMYRTVERTN